MFILFGWGFTTTKNFGRRNNVCPVCSNGCTDFAKITTWFTLFFIPIFPIGFKYVEICPNCGNGHKMGKKEFLERLGAEEQPVAPAADPFTPAEPDAESGN